MGNLLKEYEWEECGESLGWYGRKLWIFRKKKKVRVVWNICEKYEVYFFSLEMILLKGNRDFYYLELYNIEYL